MAGLKWSWRVSQVLKNQSVQARLFSNSKPVAAAWNYEWKARKVPQTKEEREAAAKKYGLIPEDYEPLGKEEGYGDYPKLPYRGVDAKDPYTAFDDPATSRNFNEPVHINVMALQADRGDPGKEGVFHAGHMILAFVLLVGTLAVLTIGSLPYSFYRPMLPKQYPYDESKTFGRLGTLERRTHYEFEAVE